MHVARRSSLFFIILLAALAVTAVFTVILNEDELETEPVGEGEGVELNLDSNIPGEEPPLTPGPTDEIPAMSSVTAGEVDGYEFVEWVDTDRNKVLSNSAEYEFILTERDRNLKAIYRAADAGEVAFYDINHDVIERFEAEGFDPGEDAPSQNELPVKPGWEPTGEWTTDITGPWSENPEALEAYDLDAVDESLNELVKLYPIYERTDDTEYAVTVEDHADLDDNVLYDTRATFEAPEAPEGEEFSHWERDGSIVSFDEAYTFTVLGDTTIEPVFKETAEDAEPLITLNEDLFYSPSPLLFQAQYELPEGHELLETGVLFVEDYDEDPDFDTENVGLIPSSYRNPAGEFTTGIRDIDFDQDYSVRAYVMYENGEEEEIVFSDTVINYRADSVDENEALYADFEGVTKGSYAEGTRTIGDYEWDFYDAGIWSGDTSVYGNSVRLRQGFIGPDVYFQSIDGVHLLAKLWSGDDSSEIQFEYDTGSGWETVMDGEEPLTITVDNDEYMDAYHVDIDIDETARLRIVSEDDERVLVDVVSINHAEYTDDVAPVLSGVSDDSIVAGDSYDPMEGVTATDNIDGNLTGDIDWSVIGEDAVNDPADFETLPADTYIVEYTVEDSTGNETSETKELTIDAEAVEWDYEEDFSDADSIDGGSYGEGTFESTLDWHYTNVMRDGVAVYGDHTLRMQDSDASLEVTAPEGISTLSIDFLKDFANDSAFKAFVDGDEVASASISEGEGEETAKNVTVEDIDSAGEVTLLIQGDAAQTNIDRVAWTSHDAEVETITQTFENFTSEQGYHDGSFIGENDLEWHYYDMMQDNSQAHFDNNGYTEVAIPGALQSLAIDFTRPYIDDEVELKVFVDGTQIGSQVYDGPDGDLATTRLPLAPMELHV